MDWIWKAVLIISVGTIILRIAGRKSISQMTLAQTVIMIGIGSLLIQPVSGKNIWVTFGVGGVLVGTLLLIEYLQVKFDFMEKFLTGRAVTIIEHGQLKEENIKNLRFTVDQLEMKLRQSGVSNISDVKTATLEPNGQVGIELKDEKKPATRQDIDHIMKELVLLRNAMSSDQALQPVSPSEQSTIFSEVEKKIHSTPPADRLQ
ncbi:DUF421 domain-containing protein [Halobacillus yeomjeoni]|uniref:DUF421 domain-containing protein n=1 Tax=Halobacillus yeomjeoni TaxID=311194 RepID=UPI001CD281F4|nr:DUF421 domain-containing protein [Halobacillus yeomjeoni]MCA0984168.1 DUF421 domain-containing protein [Halobacillus yeomjeoni]